MAEGDKAAATPRGEPPKGRRPTSRLRSALGAFGRTARDDEYAGRLRVGWSDGSDPPRRTLPLVLLLLTFTTGLVDAVSYLGLGRVFTGLQTANLVVLGFAVAGTSGFAVGPPAVSLAAFFLGAAVGGRLATELGSRHRRWFALALSVEAALMAVAALIATRLEPGTVSDAGGYVVIAVLAVAMGVRSATISRLSAPGLSTTVLTSTITALAADVGSLRAGVARPAWQLATVGARLLGAVAGALLVQVSLSLPFMLVAAITVLAAGAYVAPVVLRAWRRRRASRPPRASRR